MVDLSQLEAASAASGPKEDALEAITTKAQEAADLLRQIEELDAILDTTKKQYNAIALDKLPKMMRDAGLENFALSDGTKINIKEMIFGKIPDETKFPKEHQEALDYIKGPMDGSSLFKHEFKVMFGKNQDNEVGDFKAHLEEAEIPADHKYGVHHQTLLKTVREIQGDGSKLPDGSLLDLGKLGLEEGAHAKFKLPPKEKKG